MNDQHECIQVHEESHIVYARQRGRHVADLGGFRGTNLTIIATVISELARNLVDYANSGGEICIEMVPGPRPAIVVRSSDSGPGIPDLDRAMTDGYSTGGGLGLGLPGVRRLMDEFAIESEPGKGTVITATLILPR